MKNPLLAEKPKNMRELKPYLQLVKKINQIEKTYTALTDQELQAKTIMFKERLANGETIHDLTVEAFATVREASRRVLGMRHFDVQLLGGLVLVKGNISEMRTGEGKTLVASLPAYLFALEGKGAHIITVNDYLAKRDKELIGQIHEFLGLRVGLNIAGLSSYEKKTAYECDITYGVGTEFGFDYLRDNMVRSKEQKVQRPYHFAIIDEIDSVLIDEARTPLIIAGKDQPSGRLYKVCASVVKNLKQDDEYTFDPEMKVVNFTEKGINKCEKVFGVKNLFDLEHSSLFHSLLQALRARVLFERDVDYIVDDGEIKLVDMNTGRIMEGRSLSDGLHQAIESKEGLVNTDENKTYASITIQNYYRMYPILSGMTGTAKTEEKELREVYNMDVIPIPTNKPSQREDLPDLVFSDKEAKNNFLLEEVRRRHNVGQPILIGTTSILQSEEIAATLDEGNVEYQLLNAKSVEKEAHLIAMAGQKEKVTIATNMAGRGTDIMLGEGAREIGGLHVIGTERNESQRVDNQLKGRSGRQGDPGSTQFIISLEDYLFTRYAPDELDRIKPRIKTDSEGLITSANVHKFVETAQRISEGMHYAIREYNLKLEGVLNEQRKVIYDLRDSFLETEKVLTFLSKQTQHLPSELIDTYFDVELLPEEMDLHPLQEELNRILMDPVSIEDKVFNNIDEIKKFVEPAVHAHAEQLLQYQEDEEIVSTVKGIALVVIDDVWKAHLDSMNQLKEGIGIRQYQQEDPIQLFEKEGYALFQSMFKQLTYEIALRTTSFIQKTIAQREDTI
ncbi:accessory Sec system translocase SecA2 [Virgibacillus halodenitrificans]|uniref:accessory Sec system translocase SecA2 n=1 Tax=Virgibacillus halodenitrificans TaxID=1482 RepID=UPI000EF52572|nr:accessory Sec system translocase SecA2 [Virgibacillus halodenitrificans]MCG1027063.1 accessory Sec system translocase SecA2 [Virgibacillus halodenitrificans]